MDSMVKGFVSLTFDDGPSPYTLEILQILKKFKIKATFFVTGESLSEHPEILKAVVLDGHTIANHTWNHPDITKLSKEDLYEEIHSLNVEIQKLTEQDVKFFRPPYGKITKDHLYTIVDFGLVPVFWDIDTNDWDSSITEPIERRVMESLKQHNIILMHDGGGPRERTVKALPKIIKRLKRKGYKFLPISDYFREVHNRTI